MNTPRRRAARLVSAVAGLAIACLTLTGCLFSVIEPPAATETRGPAPTDGIPEDLLRFYEQELTWTDCGEGFDCTDVTAPLDWDDPDAGEIELAVVRHRASGEPIGSLLTNPGGPGASGVDLIRDSLDFAVGEALIDRFDVIGFDPRGVGQSTAVRCLDAAGMDERLFGIPPGTRGSAEWNSALAEGAADFAAACEENSGGILEFITTEQAARDLDLLRGVLGDETLNYLGYSYGSFLGATYAKLFPERVGRLVLDGAIDPSTTDFDVTKTQAMGFESALRAYLADCVGRSGCPFTGSVDAAVTRIQQILDRLDAAPIEHHDGRLLGSGTMFVAIILPLYSQETWPLLDDLFIEVQAGETATAFYLADYYNARNANGTYRDNSTEAFLAINCLDYRNEVTPESMRAEAKLLAEAAPLFGPAMSWGGTLCEVWPYPSERDRVAIHAPGSSDILVIGTTNDPATPYVWAVALADQLENGHLVTFEGEGHTAYGGNSTCIDETVDAYFIDGAVPASDPRC